MTRKDYKRLCRQGKTKSYRLRLAGTILASAGAVAVIAGYLLAGGSLYFSVVLLILALGFALALAGVVVDSIGELLTTRGYKAYINGNISEAFKDASGSYILENQNGKLSKFTDADISNYLEEMFINPEQFVSLTAPMPQKGLRFIQAAMNGNDVELQLGLDTGGAKLVFKPNLSEYMPVEFQ